MNVWTAAAMAFGGLAIGMMLGALVMHEMMDRAFRDYLQKRQRKIVDLERRRHEKAGTAGRKIRCED